MIGGICELAAPGVVVRLYHTAIRDAKVLVKSPRNTSSISWEIKWDGFNFWGKSCAAGSKGRGQFAQGKYFFQPR